MARAQIQIPEAFRGLFEPSRYKVYYGGRGGAKSHNIARYLLIIGAKEKHRILCTRELQGSIRDSVHKLLSDIIDEYGLASFYEVQKDTIRGKNGTEFFFKGLKHNASEIKSTEGITRCWVEEAALVSDNSWETLIPTIRAPNSEIIISFNPKHPTDPTYIRFIQNADENTYVKKVSWADNPFFPDVLELERRKMLADDPKAYKHVWEGDFDERHFGGVYATYVDKAREEGRVTHVPYQDGIPVITAWDLGKSDSTAIWFCQTVGLQTRVIDYHESHGKDLAYYAKVIREMGYEYEKHFLPHDAGHERLGMGGSIKSQLEKMGIDCSILKIGKVASRIENGRNLLKTVWIDKDKCADGIHCLMNYQYEWDQNKQRFKDKPLHDWASDGSDAFGYLAQALAKNPIEPPNPIEYSYVPRRGPNSWMGS